MICKRRVAGIIAIILLSEPTAYAAFTVFHGERWYEQPGLPTLSFTRNPEVGYEFHAYRNPDNHISVLIEEADQPGYANTFEFAAPFRGELAPGLYEGVTQYPFQDFDKPGLWYSISTFGASNFTGQFQIWEVEYGNNGTISRFAADFLISQPSIRIREWHRGQLRFNSTLAIPEPSGATLFSWTVVAINIWSCRNHFGPSRLTARCIA